MPGARLLVFTWLKLGWPGLVVPWRSRRRLGAGPAYLLWPDWFTRHVVQAARDQLAALVLPAPLAWPR